MVSLRAVFTVGLPECALCTAAREWDSKQPSNQHYLRELRGPGGGQQRVQDIRWLQRFAVPEALTASLYYTYEGLCGNRRPEGALPSPSGSGPLGCASQEGQFSLELFSEWTGKTKV